MYLLLLSASSISCNVNGSESLIDPIFNTETSVHINESTVALLLTSSKSNVSCILEYSKDISFCENMFKQLSKVLKEFHITIPDSRVYLGCCKKAFSKIPVGIMVSLILSKEEFYKTCLCGAKQLKGKEVTLSQTIETFDKMLYSISTSQPLKLSEDEIITIIKFISDFYYQPDDYFSTKSCKIESLNLTLLEFNLFEELLSAVSKNKSLRNVQFQLTIDEYCLEEYKEKSRELIYSNFFRQIEIKFFNRENQRIW